MLLQSKGVMVEDVNTRKMFRACARGIVYTYRRTPRALALHLQLCGVGPSSVEAGGAAVRGLSAPGRPRLHRTSGKPSRARLCVPMGHQSTARAIVRLRPSLRPGEGVRLALPCKLVQLSVTVPGRQILFGVPVRSIQAEGSAVPCPAGLTWAKKVRISQSERRALGLQPWDEGRSRQVAVTVGSPRCRSCPSCLDRYLERDPGRVRCCHPELAFTLWERMHGRVRHRDGVTGSGRGRGPKSLPSVCAETTPPVSLTTKVFFKNFVQNPRRTGFPSPPDADLLFRRCETPRGGGGAKNL